MAAARMKCARLLGVREDSRRRPGPIVAFAIDVLVVIAFVVIGRRSHDEGTGLRVTFEVAAPFLLALSAGWLVARAWRAPCAIATGMRLWAATMVFGLGLRRVAFDRGIAPTFVVVSCLFFLVGVVGWRTVAQRAAQRVRAPVGS
jgi:cytochrome bd-type quinol oxidase subunit 1